MKTAMTTRERIANRLITEAVANYRLAAKASRAKRDHLPFVIQMAQASGKLDALHELFPKLPAWTDTKWIH